MPRTMGLHGTQQHRPQRPQPLQQLQLRLRSSQLHRLIHPSCKILGCLQWFLITVCDKTTWYMTSSWRYFVLTKCTEGAEALKKSVISLLYRLSHCKANSARFRFLVCSAKRAFDGMPAWRKKRIVLRMLVSYRTVL